MEDVKDWFQLREKVALVTGAGKGIGATIARALSSAGATVAIVYNNSSREAMAIEKDLAREGREVMCFKADVSREEEVKEMVRCVSQRYGRLDILVNNAGIFPHDDALEMPIDEWERVMNVDLRAVFLCAREAARRMVSGGKGGRIVNISSIAGIQPEIGFVHYSTAKGGVVAMTRALASSGAPTRLR